MNKITYEERKAVYETAICEYGVWAQTDMVFEEMAELQKELCKRRRGKDNLEEIAEEIADVMIMMEQLRIIFDVNEKVYVYMDQKVQRLREKLEKEN